jgi:hypothetical protein
MLNRRPAIPQAGAPEERAGRLDSSLPRPTLQFRLKSWHLFQRALDPLAPPKPLRPPWRHPPH